VNNKIESERPGLPERFSLIYSEEQIAERVVQLGSSIQGWIEDVNKKINKDVVCVPILRGGFFFAADLMRQFRSSVELMPVTASSYSSSVNQRPHLSVHLDVRDLNVHGRAVLLIDDICDSGRTLAVLGEKLRLAGAVEVYAAVLIRRIVVNIIHEPKWYGFSYDGPEWFVGYGMEDVSRWRNLRSVYLIKES
jgi:hypoxanthine phosphoribosyltransferase